MKNTLVALALTCLLALGACSGDNPAPPADQVTPDYSATWSTVIADVVGLDTNKPVDSLNTQLAKAGSDIRFASYEKTKDGASWCALDGDIYVALEYSATASTAYLGLNSCSFRETDAQVVADLVAGEWTKGADLMGGTKVRADDENTPAPTVTTDASRLGLALEVYYTADSTYPDQAEEALVTQAPLAEAHTVHSFEVSKKHFTLCVVDTEAGDWALYDSTKRAVTQEGTDAAPGDFDDLCTKV